MLRMFDFPFFPQTRASTVAVKRKKQPYGLRRIAFLWRRRRDSPNSGASECTHKAKRATKSSATLLPRHFMPLNLFLQNKKALIWVLFLWRRRRDSNSWTAFDGYAISSRAPSTKLGDFSIRYIFNFKWVTVGSQWKTKPFPPTVHGGLSPQTQRYGLYIKKEFLTSGWKDNFFHFADKNLGLLRLSILTADWPIGIFVSSC